MRVQYTRPAGGRDPDGVFLRRGGTLPLPYRTDFPTVPGTIDSIIVVHIADGHQMQNTAGQYMYTSTVVQYIQYCTV